MTSYLSARLSTGCEERLRHALHHPLHLLLAMEESPDRQASWTCTGHTSRHRSQRTPSISVVLTIENYCFEYSEWKVDSGCGESPVLTPYSWRTTGRDAVK